MAQQDTSKPALTPEEFQQLEELRTCEAVLSAYEQARRESDDFMRALRAAERVSDEVLAIRVTV
jgi:hypothetical protein